MTSFGQEIRPSVPVWRQWNLISNFGRRDLRAKFSATLLGWMWSLIVPVVTIGIYTVVFSVVFRIQPPGLGNGEDGIFAVWLFAGLVVWSFFSSTINAGITGLLNSGGLLQKIYFPAFAPVLGAALAVAVQSAIELVIFGAVLLFLGNVSWTWILVLPLAACLAIFSAAIATGIAVLNIHYRDLSHLVAVALQLLFYLTPIIYSPEIVPESWHGMPLRSMVELSPLSEFVMLFRALVYDLTPGTGEAWLSVAAWTGGAVVFGMLVHNRRGGDLGEQL